MKRTGMDKEKETEKTRVMDSSDIRNAAGPDKGRTRVYDAVKGDRGTVTPHRWIDDVDEPVIRPVGRNTLSGRETQIYPPMDRGQTQTYQRLDRKTRVGRDSNTRVVSRQQGGDADPAGGPAPGRSLRETAARGSAGLRRAYKDVRNVRVGDSRKFARFMKVLGVFALILLLELGYFGLARRTDNMPAKIKAARNELELTQKESVILSKEIEELGDHDSIEKNRRSWERLKEKVEKATEETSF